MRGVKSSEKTRVKSKEGYGQNPKEHQYLQVGSGKGIWEPRKNTPKGRRSTKKEWGHVKLRRKKCPAT